MLFKKKKSGCSERARRRGTVPNPPIQPQTEGGNILTALRWRGTGGGGGGLGDGKKGKNEKRGREIATEGVIVMEEEEEVEREHQLLGIKTKRRESQSDNPLYFHI